MKREQKYPNTKWFTFYNANPKNKIAGDCVVRAICTGTKLSYNEVLIALMEKCIKTGYMINEQNCYKKYLDDLGWIKNSEPRDDDNCKISVKKFIEEYALSNRVYICKVGSHHLSVIIDKKVLDTWDCTNETMHVYYTRA